MLGAGLLTPPTSRPKVSRAAGDLWSSRVRGQETRAQHRRPAHSTIPVPYPTPSPNSIQLDLPRLGGQHEGAGRPRLLARLDKPAVGTRLSRREQCRPLVLPDGPLGFPGIRFRWLFGHRSGRIAPRNVLGGRRARESCGGVRSAARRRSRSKQFRNRRGLWQQVKRGGSPGGAMLEFSRSVDQYRHPGRGPPAARRRRGMP